MPVEYDYECARCGKRSDTSFVYELCSDCLDHVRDELDDVSYRVQQELVGKISSRPGNSDISAAEHAFAVKEYGRQGEHHKYFCNWCNREVSRQRALKCRDEDTSSGLGNDYIIRCSSCEEEYQRRLKDIEDDDDRDRRRLGLL
jgi:hypothetical protein